MALPLQSANPFMGQAMERELQQLRDNLEQQRQNLELERVQQEARARELEQREKQLEQERQVDQARTSEGEVGQKRGRDGDPQHDVGSRGLLRRDGGLEGSAKQAAKPGDEDDVNCRRTAGSGQGKDIGSGKDVKREDERPGAQRRGRGNLDARGDEADMLPPARDSGDTSEWAVKMERTDRSAVLTNTSAERLRIVKALLAGWYVSFRRKCNSQCARACAPRSSNALDWHARLDCVITQ